MSTSTLVGLPGHPSGRPLRQMAMRQMQRRHGNAYVQRMLATRAVPGVQTRLQVGAVDDPLEREADEVARQVVQRTQAAPDETELQRQTAVEEETAVQRRVDTIAPQGGELAPDTEEAIQRSRGSGQPLVAPLRHTMEGAFGADFSSVRIHTNDESDTLNRALGARAFTTGADIYFRQGTYTPGSMDGQELLAHELTHVVQQGGAAQQPVRRRTSPTQEAVEEGELPTPEQKAEAEAAAQAALANAETTQSRAAAEQTQSQIEAESEKGKAATAQQAVADAHAADGPPQGKAA
ncbi:MAG: DUF4157 domain-containing protein, partial [Anaerolineales bacterium]|nr:DUF4157 domain-containing protein [Anaerolineales bacterium]